MRELRDLTAALSAPVRPVARPDDDASVVAYRARQASLSETLTQAQQHLSHLVESRQRLQESSFTQHVASLVHGTEEAAVDAAVHDIADLDDEIATTTRRIETLRAALTEVATLLHAAQRQATRSIQQACDARAHALVGEMRPLVAQLDRLETEFFTLRGRSGRGSSYWPMPLRPMGQPLSLWLAQAAAIVQE